jgi:hypothetical protein
MYFLIDYVSESILPVLTELHGDQGPQVRSALPFSCAADNWQSITVLNHLINHLSNDKREIKEAAAQVLLTSSSLLSHDYGFILSIVASCISSFRTDPCSH